MRLGAFEVGVEAEGRGVEQAAVAQEEAMSMINYGRSQVTVLML